MGTRAKDRSDASTVDRYEPEVLRVLRIQDKEGSRLNSAPWRRNPKEFRTEYTYAGSAVDVLLRQGSKLPFTLEQAREVVLEKGGADEKSDAD